MIFWYLLVIIFVFFCSCSQILLKVSATQEHKDWISSIINWRVLLSYVVFLLSIPINICAMQHGLELKNIPILESFGYLFVPVLSRLLLKEKLSMRVIMSMILVFLGIMFFYK